MSQSDSAHEHLEPVRVLSIPAGIPMCVRFLGPVLGLDTHWKAGRSIPCPGWEDCPSGIHKLGIIWRGYAAAEAWDPGKRHWKPFVLEVTEALEERLRDRDLRGETWAIHRTEEKGRSSPVVGVFCERLPAEELRQAFDIEPVLRRLFHCSALKLGTRNPLPAKVLLEPVAGKAPTLPAELQAHRSPGQEKKDMDQAWQQWERFRKRNGSAGDNSDKNGVNGHK